VPLRQSTVEKGRGKGSKVVWWLLERMKHGSGIKDRDDKSSGIEILMPDAFAKINPTDPLRLAKQVCAKETKLIIFLSNSFDGKCGFGRACNIKICALSSDLMWRQRRRSVVAVLPNSESWPSWFPSYHQPLLPAFPTASISTTQKCPNLQSARCCKSSKVESGYIWKTQRGTGKSSLYSISYGVRGKYVTSRIKWGRQYHYLRQPILRTNCTGLVCLKNQFSLPSQHQRWCFTVRMPICF
jgi:hypothetical protein